ncbi:MAG: hypothetical protein AB7O73_09525 [Bacteroidia bacterium]
MSEVTEQEKRSLGRKLIEFQIAFKKYIENQIEINNKKIDMIKAKMKQFHFDSGINWWMGII